MREPKDKTNEMISIIGASEHNLNSVNVQLPRDSITVVTGVSGSGKSSLALDTLHKEGQRRVLGAMSSYGRQFTQKMSTPQVEHISGLGPSICVDQKTVGRNPRSTVGTMTEIHDHLRLVFARLGEAHCPICKVGMLPRTAQKIAETIISQFGDTKISILAPIIQGHRGFHAEKFARIKKAGLSLARVDGEIVSLDPIPRLSPDKLHDIEAVIDTQVFSSAGQLAPLIECASGLGNGRVQVLHGVDVFNYSSDLSCPKCGLGSVEIGPRLFSFNSPYGACPECNGLGVQDRVDERLLIEDDTKTLREGAMVITTPTGYIIYSQVTMDVLNQVCNAHGFDVDIPWREMTAEQKRIVLYGTDIIKIPYGKHTLESRLKWSGIKAKPREEGFYKGIVPVIEQILKRDRNKNILRFVRSMKCQSCSGERFGPNALCVKYRGEHIADFNRKTIDEIGELFSRLKNSHNIVEKELAIQISNRADLLARLGVGYLALNRESTTLSGGEGQRIRLAAQVAGKLQGVMYVLDEPSIGLHPRDNVLMLETLRELRDNGNTVVVVEHDDDTMRAADWLIDIGPDAGEHGGEVMYCGPTDKLLSGETHAPKSRTRAFLCGERHIAIPEKRREGTGTLQILGAGEHNLNSIDVQFKLGAFNVVTGVSGSGKSTLVDLTLGRSLRQTKEEAGFHEKIVGAEEINKVIEIDQSPIGRTPRSNPATYTKLFDHIRDQFATLPEAKDRGFGKGRFSFNVKGGRCEKCEGAGVHQIGMHFLGDVEVPCQTCDSKRFNDETLEVKLRGKNIHQVLEMSVEEAATFFKYEKKISAFLNTMLDVGLGYLRLGQRATTLSGGEAQRVKLAAQLARPSTGKTLYILDEPTTGLHHVDIEVLLGALNTLVNSGNTIVAVEHNLDFIKVADWIVDLGPGSGNKGGNVVVTGTPEQVAKCNKSLIGEHLRRVFSGDLQLSFEAKKNESFLREIVLKGVNTHNLKNIDVVIPHDKLTVVTGVSGSGKSSLAFDTIYAQGQRGFALSLSTYARRYFKQMPSPPVEAIQGARPAVAIDQKPMAANPRSIVATASDIYDYFRLIFSRAGKHPNGLKFTAGMFSFSSERGACDSCRGLGIITSSTPQSLVGDGKKILGDHVFVAHKSTRFYEDPLGQHMAILWAVGQALNIDFRRPWSQLDEQARRIAMFGTSDREFDVVWRFNRKGRAGEHAWKTKWSGFVNYVNEEYKRKHADHRGEQMRVLMEDSNCPSCDGQRLMPELRKVSLAGVTIGGMVSMTVDESIGFFETIYKSNALDETQKSIIKEPVEQIITRLGYLKNVGLGYLGLRRQTSTLSGGEAQRMRLATGLGAGLRGVTYVLDEPTIGLHPRDTAKLLDVIKSLRDEGNTVVVVEHDEEVIRAADNLIDMGPGAGDAGGNVVATGTVSQVEANEASLTGKYLRGKKQANKRQHQRNKDNWIKIIGARANNLKKIDVNIPLGNVVAITGVSGSGKTSLVFDVLMNSLTQGRAIECDSINGFEKIEQIIGIEQTPIGTSPLSTPATYTGIFDQFRSLFAKTEFAVEKGFGKGQFSFNSKGGRCESCQGMGRVKIGMDFMADLWMDCEDCHGRRYNEQTLECKLKGRSIADVLEMTVDEASEIFADTKKVADSAKILSKVGIGYLQLGQPANTLSGGESQRLKLATQLIKTKKKNTKGNLYVFDEPTTGLHFDDVYRLIDVFEQMADAGHTIVVVEHNVDVVKRSDWIIDLGPEGGDQGGNLVVSGDAKAIAGNANSHTGRMFF